MDKHIVNKCSDCFHYKACNAMLVNLGLADYMPESADADRCPDFVPTADIAIVRNGGWIPVTEKMPDNEVDVLICVERRHYSDPGKFIRFVVKAFHTDGLKNTEDSAYAWSTDYTDMEYDEESDAYIIPEGWWECVEYGEEFCAVSDFVTHWMPLPKPPKEG